MGPTMTVRERADGSGLANLAEKLIKRLGVNEALRVCRENSWYGVLRFIQGRQNDGMHL